MTKAIIIKNTWKNDLSEFRKLALNTSRALCLEIADESYDGFFAKYNKDFLDNCNCKTSWLEYLNYRLEDMLYRNFVRLVSVEDDLNFNEVVYYTCSDAVQDVLEIAKEYKLKSCNRSIGHMLEEMTQLYYDEFAVSYCDLSKLGPLNELAEALDNMLCAATADAVLNDLVNNMETDDSYSFVSTLELFFEVEVDSCAL